MGNQTLNEFCKFFSVPEVARDCIDRIVSRKEQNMVLLLGDQALPIDKLANELGLQVTEAREEIKRSFSRGVLDREVRDGTYFYRVTDFYTRLDFFAKYGAYQDLPSSKRRKLDQWYLLSYADKIKPFLDDFETDGASEYTTQTPIPLNRVEKMIKRTERAVAVPCDCRSLSEDWNGNRYYCLSFDETADRILARGNGKEVPIEESLDLLEWTDRQGLMHCTDFSEPPTKPSTICNCDIRWCYPFRAAKTLETEEFWPVKVFQAHRKLENCIHCGVCVDRCQFGAFSSASNAGDNSTEVVFNPERCWGCGLCETSCPRDAIRMESRN